MIGVGGGAAAELDLLTLMAKRARLHASTLRARPLEQKADAAARVEAQVAPTARRADASPSRWPHASPMEDAEAAYERFAAGGKLGKIVLVR